MENTSITAIKTSGANPNFLAGANMESIVFELIPPPANWSEERMAKYCQNIVNILREHAVLSVCIPEVVNESREIDRLVKFVPKIDNLQFAAMLKYHYHSLVAIPCKICVRSSKEAFEGWLKRAHEKGIRHVVLVGGEHHEDSYPGYKVLEAAQYIHSHYPDIKPGGIAIFTRPNEAERIFNKSAAGINFFFSQIIFEAANMKQILLNLSRLCKGKNVQIPKIFLSLTLASKIKDIEFMKWLGVEFPSAVYAYLTENREETVEFRSSDVLDMLLDETFHFIEKENIEVGFNIEHVMYTNLFLSSKLFKNVKQRMANE